MTTVTTTATINWYSIFFSSTDPPKESIMTTINNLSKAVIAAFIKAGHTFSTADVVHCVNEALGPETKTRSVVLEVLRNKVKLGELKALAIDSKQGYGWLFYAKSPIVPSGFKLRETEKPAPQKVEGPLKTSEEWLIEKGWTLPEEGAPTGWDMSDLYQSMYVEEITEEEFMLRWNNSYDPSFKLEISQLVGDAFLSNVTAALNLKEVVGLNDGLNQFCLDKPDVEQIATKLELSKTFTSFNKKQWVEAASSCATVGELLGLAYQLSGDSAKADEPVTA